MRLNLILPFGNTSTQHIITLASAIHIMLSKKRIKVCRPFIFQLVSLTTMPSFEPSTWAEVDEAVATDKPSSHTADPFVTQVRFFTHAPERFLTRRTGPTTSSLQTIPPPPARKRPTPIVDDLLGFGRIDLDAGTFVRRYPTPTLDPAAVGIVPAAAASPINPSCAQFDPAAYLACLHAPTSPSDLREGRAILQRVRTQLDALAETFRSDKCVDAALVDAAFEGTKVALLPLSPFADMPPDRQVERDFECAEASLKLRYEHVMSREEKLARLQRALSIFKRYNWVFLLGARLRSAASDHVSAIEDAVCEYQRGVKWLAAQDMTPMPPIQTDIEDAFTHLMDVLVTRLSTAHMSRPDTSRLVTVLISVKREELLSLALSRRMAVAEEGLQKAVMPVDVPIMPIRDAAKTERDIADFVARASAAFFEGLSHVWRLGYVLMGYDRWLRIVDSHIVQLCEMYAGILRDSMLPEINLISKRAVKEMAEARNRAVSELQVPETCLGPLEAANCEILECFLSSLASAVRSGAERVATQAVRCDGVGVESAQLLCAVVMEALGQVDCALFRGKEGLDERSVTLRSISMDGSPSIGMRNSGMSGLDMLAKTCAEAPRVFCNVMKEELKGRNNVDEEVMSLQVALCCSELTGGVIQKITRKTQAGTPFDTRAVQRQLKVSAEIIGEMECKALSRYVRVLSQPLQRLATGLVSFPDGQIEDGVRRTVPIKIEGVSEGANELVLQLALITITTRKRSSNGRIIRSVLLDLISEIGQTLVQVLSTDKLAYHRAAQLWVDVSFVQEMVTKGASSDTRGLQSSLDGFSRVRERAVQAVLADGYSFSLGDMQALRESVVAEGIEDGMMVYECFAETWGLLKLENEDEA